MPKQSRRETNSLGGNSEEDDEIGASSPELACRRDEQKDKQRRV